MREIWTAGLLPLAPTTTTPSFNCFPTMSAAEASTSSAKERKQALANGEAPEDHYNPLTTTTLFVSNLPYSG